MVKLEKGSKGRNREWEGPGRPILEPTTRCWRTKVASFFNYWDQSSPSLSSQGRGPAWTCHSGRLSGILLVSNLCTYLTKDTKVNRWGERVRHGEDKLPASLLGGAFAQVRPVYFTFGGPVDNLWFSLHMCALTQLSRNLATQTYDSHQWISPVSLRLKRMSTSL